MSAACNGGELKLNLYRLDMEPTGYNLWPPTPT